MGVARSLTDFVYCTYLSDLAVDEAHQGRGIGRELIRRTKEATPQAMLILLAGRRRPRRGPRMAPRTHLPAG